MADPTLISRRYEVLEKVGQGGMATVFKVRHTTLGSVSALKILPQDLMEDPEMVTRFYREARIMAQLGHPNIVRVLDIDHDEALNFHYLVMEYVEGQTLRHRIDASGPLPIADTLDMGRQVGSALAYAHGHAPPIIHRDIKPSNIMIEASTGRFVLMDFGIAKELGAKELTRPGVTIGTLKYCPPEQMRQEPLDGAADVYALGVVLFEAFTGAHPLTGLRDRELIARVLDETVSNDPRFPDETPSAFRTLIKRAIEKKRSERLGSISELLRAIEDVQGAAEREDADQRARVAAEERERRRQAELQTKARERADKTSAARGAARAAGAERYARELYERASNEAGRGERFLGDQSWDEAGRCFAQAMALFEEATRASERERHREEARRLRTEAASLLDVAEREGARGRVPERFLDIDALLANARRSFEGDDLTTARTSFERAVGLLREARDAASRRAERDAAERELERARSMSERAIASGRRIGRRAERRLRQAEKEFAEEHFVEARQLFREATELLVADATPIAREDDETQFAPSEAREGEGGNAWWSRPPVLGALAAAALVILAIGWWSTRSSDESPDGSGLAVARQTQPDVAPPAKVPPPPPVAPPAKEPDAAVPDAVPGDPPAPPQEQALAEPPSPPGVDALPADAKGTDATAPQTATGDIPNGATISPTDAGPPAAPGADPDAPADVTGPLAKVEDLGAATGGIYAAPAPAPVLGEPIRRLTSAAKLQLEIPASGVESAVLDGKTLGAAKGDPLKVVLDKLPAGESRHELVLTDAAGASRTIPIDVTHYPGWEMRRTNKLASEAYGLDVSPDGKRAVSGSRDNLVKLWDLENGELLRSISGHRDWVNDVAFAFGGTALLSGSKDRTLKLWNADTGELVRTLEGHKGWVNSVAVSPDGKRAASVSDDRTVRIWDLEAGTLLKTLTGHADWAFAVAFAPDGRTVVSAGKDNTVRVWDIETGELKSTLRGHRDWVSTLAVAPTGDRAISGSDDRTARIWNLATGKEERVLRGHGDWVVSVAVSPDGKRAVTGSKDGSAKLWDVETGKVLRTFGGHRAMVSGLAFRPDGESFVSTGRDRSLRLWWAGPEQLEDAAVASLAPTSER
jgi:hypothetical protein